MCMPKNNLLTDNYRDIMIVFYNLYNNPFLFDSHIIIYYITF